MTEVSPTYSEVATHERRRHPRISAAVHVELMPDGDSAPTYAKTSDISCGGCYIEMNFTLPVGTKLEMVLWLGEEKLMSRGIVATNHPYVGNGIQFMDMSASDLDRLNRFLHSAVCMSPNPSA